MATDPCATHEWVNLSLIVTIPSLIFLCGCLFWKMSILWRYFMLEITTENGPQLQILKQKEKIINTWGRVGFAVAVLGYMPMLCILLLKYFQHMN